MKMDRCRSGIPYYCRIDSDFTGGATQLNKWERTVANVAPEAAWAAKARAKGNKALQAEADIL